MKWLSFLIRRIMPKRIWQQIFLVLASIVVIPLIILGVLLIYASQKAIKTTVLRDHKEIAVHATGEISEHIKGAQQALHVTAAILGRLQTAPWRQETAIVELSIKNPAFEKISSVDSEGREVATSLLGTEPGDFSKEESFRRALAGQSYVSPVKISDNHIPFLTLAEPVRQSGAVKSVLIADLNVRGIWQLVDDIRVGGEGKAFIIDENGRIIAHPDKRLVFEDAMIDQPSVVRDIRRGQSGNFEDSDKNGGPRLISYAPIKGLGWGLIITQPVREVLAFSDRMKWQSAALIFFSIFWTIILSLVLARSMIRPVGDVLDGVRRLSRGDFSHPFRIRNKNEIGRLLFSLNRMQAKLHRAQQTEKLSVMGKTAGVIAHELKNSLVLIQAFIELLPERHKDKKFMEEFSDAVPKELDAWNVSLRNMMGLLKDSVPGERVDINSLVREMGLLTKLKARQKDIRFEMDIQENIPFIHGSQEKLKQVLMNLINNSLEAVSAGGLISVRTGWVPDGGFAPHSGYVEMEVTDTGEGIKPEHLDKIFEPFFSTKKSGLGLGLSICKEIVESYKGTISVTRGPARKTSFVVKLPVGRDFGPAGGRTAREDIDSRKKSVF